MPSVDTDVTSSMVKKNAFNLFTLFVASVLLLCCTLFVNVILLSPVRSTPNIDVSRSVSSEGKFSKKSESGKYRNFPTRSIDEEKGVVGGTIIRVWRPHSKACRGRFSFNTGADLAKDELMLMIREAAFDFRHSSLSEHRLTHPLETGVPFRRIAILVTVSRGVARLLPATATNTGQETFPSVLLKQYTDTQISGWRVKIDYILRDPLCRNRCPYDELKKKKCYAAEWQVIVSLNGPEHIKTEEGFQEALEGLLRESPVSARLELKLPVFLASENEEIVETELSVGLSCISSDISLQNILTTMPKRTECRDARGSVVVAGGALWGYKSDNRAGRREVANFVARSLMGSIRFDTVAVPVIAKHSVSEIQAVCQHDKKCQSEIDEKNDSFMRGLVFDVEDELKMLKIPRTLWKRILLFPVCRLGTDFEGYERDQGCKYSRYQGQGMVNDLSYILFSPYHKWYASFDLDEFAVQERAFVSARNFKHGKANQQSAQVLFDERSLANNGGASNVLQLGWLEFDVPRAGLNDFSSAIIGQRNATRELMQTGGLDFIPLKQNRSHLFNRSDCWQRRRTPTMAPGKAVVSCMRNGFGSSVHHAMALTNAANLNSRKCIHPVIFDNDIALYHGSTVAHGIRFGNCAWRTRRAF